MTVRRVKSFRNESDFELTLELTAKSKFYALIVYIWYSIFRRFNRLADSL